MRIVKAGLTPPCRISEVTIAEMPVVIAGGGPAGLAASLALSELGVLSLLVSKYEHISSIPGPRADAAGRRVVSVVGCR